MKFFKLLIVVFVSVFSVGSVARDDVKSYPIVKALSSDVAKSKLGNNVSFYFGEQRHAEIETTFGEFKTNKKTNSFNKSDEEACDWAFLSAIIALKEQAIKNGGNAVIEIKSNYKNNLTSNNDTFQCGAGMLMAGVALTGKVVRLK